MIKRIYVDNFSCLCNFEVQLEQNQLWLGDNGSGKSSVIKALKIIQKILSGNAIDDFLTSKSLCRWDKRSIQTFSIDIQNNGNIFSYSIMIEYGLNVQKCRINKEELKWNDKVFYLFDQGEAHLYRINKNSNTVEEGVSFPASWNRSVIATIAERADNWPVITFRNVIKSVLIIHPIPILMQTISEDEEHELSISAENFASWYRHVIQEVPSIPYKAQCELEKIIPNFIDLSLLEFGDSRKLSVRFSINSQKMRFDFAELSDGQRQLIVLYILLEAMKENMFTSIFIDEPDCFLSLSEVVPWLREILDESDSSGNQIIVISHHPGIINTMVHGKELYFKREKGTNIVTSTYPVLDGLTPAESVEQVKI